MAFLEVDHLSVTLPTGKILIDDISFQIHSGEVLACIGGSGAGKSSLIQALMRIALPGVPIHYSGAIFFESNRLQSQSDFASHRGSEISLIFQDPASVLNPVQTIGEQIEEVLLLHTDLGAEERFAKVLEVMGLVGLTPSEQLYFSYPHQFSGGMKQRVVIAASIVGEPKLIMADEPTTALDPPLQREIIEMIVERVRGRNCSFFLVTHDLSLVEAIADRVIVLSEGKIVETGDVISIMQDPKHHATKTLIYSWRKLWRK